MRSSTTSLQLQVESTLAGRVASPFRLRDAAPPPVVPSGVAAIDELTGGLPRGGLTEIYGAACAGKTSILQSALAARTGASEVCALVDAQDAFDPCGAQAAGVFLQRLLWVRCQTVDNALRSLDLLLHGGGFGLVALDLSDVPVRLVRQISLNVWFRLRRAVEDTSTVFVVLAQESNAKSCASLVLRLERDKPQWSLAKRQDEQGVPSDWHTQACLLDGGQYSAEMIRAILRRKRLHFIDQPSHAGQPTAIRFTTDVERCLGAESPRESSPETYDLVGAGERIQSPD